MYGTTVGDGKFEAGELFERGAGLPNNVVNLLISFKNNNKLGNGPQTGVVFGSGGVIYGNAIDGGAHSSGMIFELTSPANQGGAWTETDLWDFTGSGPDAAQPIGNIAVDSGGSIYGVTYGGGGGAANLGAVFKLVP